jgi:hypothetical protein
VTDDPRLMAHWALDVVRSGTTGGKQIEISTMRRLTLDLNAPNGEQMHATILIFCINRLLLLFIHMCVFFTGALC